MPITTQPPGRRPVALLFPGQGAQQAGMAAGLYGAEEVFTGVLDSAFALLDRLGDGEGARVRHDWLCGDDPELLDDVTRAQPLLYAVGYGLGRLVESWGVEPAALLGHSVGELVAATLAGVVAFEDAVRLIHDRMRIFADTPPGGMLAVAASPGQAEAYVSGEVALAAVNGPKQVLLAGPDEQLTAVRRRLQADGVTCKRARARQAFHSPAVAGAVARSAAAWEATPFHAPRRRLYSAYVGDVLSPGRARDPRFWANQPVEPVLWGPTLDRLLHDGDFLLVEAGAGQGLSALARRHPAVAGRRSAVTAMLPVRSGDPEADRAAVRKAADRIRAEGHELSVAAGAAVTSIR